MNTNPKLNQSGNKDLTAYEAIKNVSREEEERNKLVHNLIFVLKFIVNLAGFELTERIKLREKRTKRKFE